MVLNGSFEGYFSISAPFQSQKSRKMLELAIFSFSQAEKNGTPQTSSHFTRNPNWMLFDVVCRSCLQGLKRIPGLAGFFQRPRALIHMKANPCILTIAFH
jgi:hypothetical protein